MQIEKITVNAPSRRLKGYYLLENNREWPKWLREQAELHEKSAAMLKEVADYIEQENVDLDAKSISI